MKNTFPYGSGFEFPTILLTSGSRDAKSNPTLVAGDVQISKDFGAFANLDTLPTVSPASDVQVKVTLSDTECQANIIMIRFKDASGAEWEEQTHTFHAIDQREGKVRLYTQSGFVERSAVKSQNIINGSEPIMSALFTTSTSSSKGDFDTRQILGAMVYQPDNGLAGVIVGGYYFDDSDDKTYNPFGVAHDVDLFGITEGGSNTIDTNWSGQVDSNIDEPGNGSGWTFILMAINKTTETFESGKALEMYINPSPVIGATFNDRLLLKSIEADNDQGSALIIRTSKLDTTAAIIEGTNSGSKGLHIKGGTGSGSTGLKVESQGESPGLWLESSASAGLYIVGGNQSENHAVEIRAIGADAHAISVVAVDGSALYGYAGGADNPGLYMVGGNDSGAKFQGGAAGAGIEANGGPTNGSGMKLRGQLTGNDLDAEEIGTPTNLGDGASIAGGLTALAGKTNGAGSYDRTQDSQEAIRDRGDAAWVSGTGITQQQVRDAMKLAPSGGAAASDSVDDKLDTIDGKSDTIITDVATVDGKADTTIAGLAVIDSNVDAIVAKLPADDIAGVSDTGMKLTDSVDGVTVDTLLQYVMAMSNGRFVKSVVGEATRITFYKRDNTTVLFTVDVTNTVRSRV